MTSRSRPPGKSRGCLDAVAGLLTVLFTVTAAVVLFSFNFIDVATDRQAVKDSLPAETQLQAVFLDLVAQRLRETIVGQILPLEAIDPATFQAQVARLVPENWMRRQMEAAVDAIFDSLESQAMAGNPRTAGPELTLNVTPLLDSLRGEPGLQLITELMRQLPACPLDSLLPLNPQTGALEIGNCLPSFVSAEQAASLAHASLAAVLDFQSPAGEQALNLRFSLLPQGPAGEPARRNWGRLAQLVQLSQEWAWSVWLLPLAILLLITLLGVRSFSQLLTWWGWSLLGAAVLALFFSFLFPYVGDSIRLPLPFLDDASIRQAPMLADFAQLFRGTLANLARIALLRVRWQALFILMAGLLSIGFGYGLSLGRSARM